MLRPRLIMGSPVEDVPYRIYNSDWTPCLIGKIHWGDPEQLAALAVEFEW